jgi:lipoyl(octanoyl) transferase
LGIETGRIPGLTGVWVDHEDEKRARKICALGVKTSRWVTMHGLAFNVNSDLNYFKNIIPCGIDDKAVTSVQMELRQPQDLNKVSSLLRQNIVELFDMEIV